MKEISTLSDWLESWFLWIPVTGISWSTGLVIALVAAKGMSSALPEEASLAISSVAIGVLIGLAQWLILRPQAKGVGWWSLATVVGWTTGLVVTTFVVRVSDLALGRVIGAALGGFVFGFSQWLVLYPGIRGRGKWVLATAGGWTAALALGITLPDDRGLGMIRGGVVEIAISGAMGLVIMGMVTIVALVLLFPKPRKKASDAHVKW